MGRPMQLAGLPTVGLPGKRAGGSESIMLIGRQLHALMSFVLFSLANVFPRPDLVVQARLGRGQTSHASQLPASQLAS